MRLKGKVAIVTGAGSGFGEGIARGFAEQGATVIVNDIDEQAANRVAKDLAENQYSAFPCTGDVSCEQDIERLVSYAQAEKGRLDVVVNNAGVTHRNQPMLDVSEEEYDRVFSVNVKACFLMSRHVVPIFKKQGGGVILNIGSIAGLRPRPGLTWYCASKGAIISMTKSMAIELASDQIRVNVICPVAGDTPMLAQFLKDDTEESRNLMLSSIPMGRLANPLDVANAAIFLASDESTLITGMVCEVDGGRGI